MIARTAPLPAHARPGPDATGLRLGIVAARWNGELVDQLVTSAADAAHAAGAQLVPPIYVAGAGELPLAVQALARTGTVDAVVAAAVVIRGGTPHFETVLQRATTGLLQVSLTESTPIADAVLAVYDRSQALGRLGGPDATEDKGAAAAEAALDLALVVRDLPAAAATADPTVPAP